MTKTSRPVVPRPAAPRRPRIGLVLAVAAALAASLALPATARATQERERPARNTDLMDTQVYLEEGSLADALPFATSDEVDDVVDRTEQAAILAAESSRPGAPIDLAGVLIGEFVRRGVTTLVHGLVSPDSGWDRINEKKITIFVTTVVGTGRDTTVVETDADLNATVELVGFTINPADPLSGRPARVVEKRVARFTYRIQDGRGDFFKTFNTRKLRNFDVIVPVIRNVRNDTVLQDAALFCGAGEFHPARGEPNTPGRAGS